MRAKKMGVVKDYESIRVAKDGTRVPVELTINAIKNNKGDILGTFAIIRDITERKNAEKERDRLILELKNALDKVKRLSGLLPICSVCKRIRDDKGYWNQVEVYIRDHSEVDFSHGLCPECSKKLYPKYNLP
jgi:CRISPR/Cas system-associated protein Cas10 (large subunit of type III CRISPR-Cas system)